MGQELWSIFQLERKKLFWLIGIAVAMILAFHYLELPYSSVQPIVFSANNTLTSDGIRLQTADVSSESEMVKNMTFLNEANSTGENALEIVNETRTSEEKDTVSNTGLTSVSGRESSRSLGFDERNESSTVESIEIANNGSATEQTGNLGLSIYNNTISHSPSHAIAPPLSQTEVSPNITSPMLSNDYDEIDFMEEERFRPSKDEFNIVGNNSFINRVPKETEGSQIPLPEVTTISEMNELLLQNHASYRSMRPRWSSAVDQELLQARSEIENAPIVNNVENLYAPLFRNISRFKRSYELMERTLKVYVYR